MTHETQTERNENHEIRVIAVALIALILLLVTSVTIAVSTYRSEMAAAAPTIEVTDDAAPVLRD